MFRSFPEDEENFLYDEQDREDLKAEDIDDEIDAFDDDDEEEKDVDWTATGFDEEE